MTNEEINKIKLYYDFLKSKVKEIEDIDEQILKLKYDPSFMEYFSLQNRRNRIFAHFLKYGKLDDASLIEQTIDNVGINDPSDIYVCMGTYKKLNGYNIESLNPENIVEKDDPNAQFRIYINIENGAKYEKSIAECEHFEIENRVLYPPKECDSYKYYGDIRTRYFQEAMNNGLESAKQKIIEFRNTKYGVPGRF